MASSVQSLCNPPPVRPAIPSPRIKIHPHNSTLFRLPATRPRFPSLSSFPRFLTTANLSSVASPSGISSQDETKDKKFLLEVKDLTAVISETKQQILKGVNLSIREGEVHAIMGQNGSGKSTFAKVLAGHPDYEVTGGSLMFKGENLLDMAPEERSLAGLFMSFQSPVAIPGVSNNEFLMMAYNAKMKKLGLPELDPIQFFTHLHSKLGLVNMKIEFVNRNVNEGFSGGERKRNEILQLAVLGADLAILDEIDSGLDVDALRDVANAVNGLMTSKNSILMITHYKRLLELIEPAFIHVMEDGRIVRTGDKDLAKILEKEGFKGISDT